MKYKAGSFDGVYYFVQIVPDDYKAQDGEIILGSEDEAILFPIPCKIVNGEYVHCAAPIIPPQEMPSTVYQNPTQEERISALESAMLSMMGVNTDV